MQITQDILEKINHYDTIILHRHMVPWSLSAILPTPLASMTNATQVAIF